MRKILTKEMFDDFCGRYSLQNEYSDIAYVKSKIEQSKKKNRLEWKIDEISNDFQDKIIELMKETNQESYINILKYVFLIGKKKTINGRGKIKKLSTTKMIKLLHLYSIDEFEKKADISLYEDFKRIIKEIVDIGYSISYEKLERILKNEK